MLDTELPYLNELRYAWLAGSCDASVKTSPVINVCGIGHSGTCVEWCPGERQRRSRFTVVLHLSRQLRERLKGIRISRRWKARSVMIASLRSEPSALAAMSCVVRNYGHSAQTIPPITRTIECCAPRNFFVSICKDGGRCRIRTCDPMIKSHLL